MKTFIAVFGTIAGLLAINSAIGQIAVVSFTVTVPEFSSQGNRAVHLVGSFNGWKPNDSLYIMKLERDKTYSLAVPLFDGKNYQYKYTLGEWSTVEVAINDSNTSNRHIYSQNGMNISDTVQKWRMPAPATTKAISPQMQRIMSMKDSLAATLQAMIAGLLPILKEYNENMLSPNPSKRLHKKHMKQTMELFGKMYAAIEEKMWAIGTSLSPEQKSKILEALKKPAAPNDLINNIKSAYGEALK